MNEHVKPLPERIKDTQYLYNLLTRSKVTLTVGDYGDKTFTIYETSLTCAAVQFFLANAAWVGALPDVHAACEAIDERVNRLTQELAKIAAEQTYAGREWQREIERLTGIRDAISEGKA